MVKRCPSIAVPMITSEFSIRNTEKKRRAKGGPNNVIFSFSVSPSQVRSLGLTYTDAAAAAAAKSLQSCPTLCDPAHQAPPPLGFSRQEHWSGLPFPSPMHESEK